MPQLTATAPFDFDTIIDRRQTDSVKWRQLGWDPLPPDVLPLWVADMDFRSPERVVQALRARVDEGVFGYALDGAPELRPAIQRWMANRHGWEFAAEDIINLPNLVSALYAAVRAYSAVGDNVLTLLPVYPPFLMAIRDSERELRRVDMVQNVTAGVLRFEIDFEALEQAIDPRTKLLMLCNPQNPVGRVFTEAELRRLADLCLKHDLIICSDEIHADLVLEGKHIPFASLSPEIAQRTITLSAPSKTFNIPGLGYGFVTIHNAELKTKFKKITEHIVSHPGALGYVGALAAYTDTSGWLEALIAYLRGNRDYTTAYLQAHLPAIKVTHPEGTYLSWLDCRDLKLTTPKAQEFFLTHAKVGLVDGGAFGTGYEHWVRLNFGCSRSVLHEALERMRRAVEAHHPA
jgi:cysteine-S-conjugate beta-lyase